MTLEFFMPMLPPTVTHQEKQFASRHGRLICYDPPELKDARAKLTAHLAQHAPEMPFTTGVRLIVKWLFSVTGTHKNGEYKLSKPDTDNLQKLLKDVMTELGFWKDDALVCSETVEKFYSDVPGIYIMVVEMEG